MKDIPTNGELKPKKKWKIHWRYTNDGKWRPQFQKAKRKRFYPSTPKK